MLAAFLLGVVWHRLVAKPRPHSMANEELQPLFELALQSSTQGLALLNDQGQVLFWNRRMEGLTGISSLDASQRLLHEIPAFSAVHAIVRMISGVTNQPLLHPLVFRTQLTRTSPGQPAPMLVTLSRISPDLPPSSSFLLITLQDISESEELRDRLQMALYKAETSVKKMAELDRLKSEFLAICSHELKTPLVSITGYLDLLQAEKFGPITAKQRDALDVSIRNASRLNEILSSLLDFARMEAGKMRFEFLAHSLQLMIEEIVKIMEPLITARQVSLKVELPPDLPHVYMDSGLIHRVFLNLIDNAVKFTPTGGVVTLRAWADEQLVFAEVSDNGRGIDPEKIARVKEPFFQADASNTRTTGGLGLGLAIVEKILAGHGSSLELTSLPGQGTTARFALKKAVRSASGTFLAVPSGMAVPPSLQHR